MNNPETLSDKQENAIELILQGMNDTQVAERVGTTRQMVNKWRNHNCLFQQTLTQRRQILHQIHSQQLQDLVDESIRVLQKTLRSKNSQLRFRAALYVLKLSGLEDWMKHEASCTPTPQDALIQALHELAEEMGFEER